MWLIPELPAPLPCALEASRDDRANGESCEADFQARPAGRELAVTSGCKPRCSPWQVTLWGRASPVVFPCGKLRLLCWSPPRSPGVPGTRSASPLPSVPGWAQPPILRHKPGLIHRFCGTPGMGTQPSGSQKCSAWSCCACWAEVNKRWWCGQREAPVSAPCAAGSWDHTLLGSHRGFFLGFVGGQADTPGAVLPRAAISLRAFELCSSLWPLLVEPGRAGSDSRQERLDGGN